MLKVFDQNKNAKGFIVKYKDLCIESDLSTGDKSLSFVYFAKKAKDIRNEYYVETQDDRFVVKEADVSSDGWPEYRCQLDLEDLESYMHERFSAINATLEDAARLAVAGTGWRIDTDITKVRSVATLKATPLAILGKIKDAWMCEVRYDTKNKIVYFRERFGEDRGVYFTRQLNLRKVDCKSDSYDFYTRIIPIGADGLRIEDVNGGKDYVENYQYSTKVRTLIWEDTSYEDAEALKEDAQAKLEDLSRPKKSYSADVIDLARQSTKYSILAYGLGDTVLLLDEPSGIRDRQRIVKLKEYPDDPSRNTCELSNTTLTFEEQQAKLEAAAAALEDISNADGTINGVYVHGVEADGIVGIETVINGSSAVQDLNAKVSAASGNILQINGEIDAVKGRIGTLEITSLKSTEAALKYATIEQLTVTNEEVHRIQGDYADFKTTTTKELAAQTGIIDNLSGQFSSFQTSMSQEMITAKGWMLEGAIGDAQISKVSANKLGAGTIDTAIVTVAGTDGRLQIQDNTIQIKDANRVRVQIGKDAGGDYSMSVWDASGQLIWDALGATENTIQRKIIRDRMVADDAAIQALKLDLQSFNTALTNQGVTISGTVVQVGNKTLNVALSEQTQTISDNYTALKSYTDTAKAAAISAAASDAATKANNALANAKSYADAIEIGGRNLLLDTELMTVKTGGTTTARFYKTFADVVGAGGSLKQTESGLKLTFGANANVSIQAPLAAFGSVENDENVTLSFDYRGNITKFGNWYFLQKTGGNICIQGFPDVVADGEWHHYEHTFSSPNANVRTCVSILMFYSLALYDSTKWVEIKRGSLKLEKGTKATDWTPAPEDTEAELHTHAEQLSSHETRIAANEKGIELKVATSDFNSYKTTVNGELTSAKSRLSTAESSITAMQGKIALKVEQTDIDSAVENLHIGGRNLLPETRPFDECRGMAKVAETYQDLTVRGGTLSGSQISVCQYDFTGFSLGDVYTLSFYAKGNVTQLHAFFYGDTGYVKAKTIAVSQDGTIMHNSYSDGNALFHVTNEWKRYWVTWQLDFTGDIGVHKYILLRTDGSSAGQNVYVCGMKLEKGTKATDWTPALEDIDASITAVDNKFANYSTTTQMQSAINLAKDSITSTVSETYATKSALNSANSNISNLTTRVSSAEQKLTKDSLVTTIGSYYATQTYVDDLEIGGRNLEEKTNQGTTDWSKTVQNGTYILNSVMWQNANALKVVCEVASTGYAVLLHGQAGKLKAKLKPATLYILSLDTTYPTINLYGVASPSALHNLAASITLISRKKTSYGYHCTWKFKTADEDHANWQYSDQLIYFNGLGNGEINHVANLKVEAGTKATDWSPAPEDTLSYIADVETIATQTKEKFNWIVKSGTSATDFTLTDRTAQLITEKLTIKDSTGASTIISGGKMDINKIFAQDITATGTIQGVTLEGVKGKIANFTVQDTVLYGGNIAIYNGSSLNGGYVSIGGSEFTRCKVNYRGTGVIFNDTVTGNAFTALRVQDVGMSDTDPGMYTDLTLGFIKFQSGEVVNTISANGRTGVIKAKNIELSDPITVSAIELSSAYPFIDFHFGNHEADYTTRIIEHQFGQLSFEGVNQTPVAINGKTSGESSIRYYYNGDYNNAWVVGPGAGTADMGKFGFYHAPSNETRTYIKSDGEIVTMLRGASQFRAVNSGYGFMIRNDGLNTYFLLTANGDPYGSWRNTFPFIIGNGDGMVQIQTGLIFPTDVGIQSSTGYILRTFNASNYSNLTGIGNTSSQASIYTSNRVWKNGSTSTYFSTTSSSDKRLKEEAGDMASYESFFEALRPVPFKYHEGLYDAPNRKPKIQWGFYAQDVVDAFERNGINWHDQELVVVEDGDLTAEELKYVQPGTLLKMNYQNLTALNTHMIQKHSRDISRIEYRQESAQYLLNTLQNTVAELQAEINRLRLIVEAA